MQDAAQPVKAVHEFLEGIDWELLEEAADMGAGALRFVRRHPWTLVATGLAMSAFGAWQMVQQRRGTHSAKIGAKRYSETDLMAP